MRSFTTIFGVLAAAITAVSAYTTPVGTPVGNPIFTPGLNQVVPAGKPFEITWNPTTSGTVTLVLLRGPSTNVVPLYAIVEKIANSGKYSWTPSTSLVPDVSHYGIQLIDDATGQYQYSTQFGIANAAYVSSSSVKMTSTAPAYVSSTSVPVYATTSTPAYVSSASITKTSTTSSCTSTTLTTSCSSTTTSVAPYSTHVSYNVTAPTATPAPAPAPYTGAASGNAVQLGMALFAGAVGAFAAVF